MESENRARPSSLLLLLPAFAFFFLVCVPVLLRAALYGYHNFDLGIYAQALARLSFTDPNPFLTVRQLHIFSDHFDPILWLGVPIARFFPAPLGAIVVEFLFTLLAALLPVWLCRKGQASFPVALSVSLLLLFSTGTLAAMAFPIHPTAWSVLPVMLLCWAIAKDRFALSLVALNLLFACKEEFIFVGFMYLAILAWRRQWPRAALVGLLTLCWAIFVFYIRYKVFPGPFVDYGGSIVSGFFTDPLGMLQRAFGVRKVGQNILLLFAPFIFLAAIGIRKGGRLRYEFLLLAIPPVALRVLGGVWSMQYLPPVIGFFASAILFSFSSQKWPRWVPGVLAFFLVAVNAEALVKNVRLDVPFLRTLTTAEKFQRKAALDDMRRYIEARPGNVVAQANLVPNLVKHEGVYQFRRLLSDPRATMALRREGSSNFLHHAPYTRIALPGYRFLFLEKPPFGNDYDVGYEFIDAMIQATREKAPQWVRMENRWAILFEGDFRTVAP